MGFFYKAAAGGANDPTYPTTPLTFDTSTRSQTFTLTNTGDTPASVELSFSSLSGGQTLLIGEDYDQGTDTSPTYVVDPDTGTRTITLARGALIPASQSTEIVTMTSNAGALPQTITCTIDPLTTIQEIVRVSLNATPTIEYTYDGVFTNSGSLGSSFDLTANAGVSAASTTDYPWAIGAARINTTSGNAQRASTSSTHFAALQDRTWIWAWKNDGAVTAGYAFTQSSGSRNNGPGWITLSGSFWGAVQPTFAFNATNGTAYPSGTATGLTLASGELNILCASYNHSTNQILYMYKSSNQATGQHTYRTGTDTTSPYVNTETYYGIGENYSAVNVKAYYSAVYDRQTTNAEFQYILDNLGV